MQTEIQKNQEIFIPFCAVPKMIDRENGEDYILVQVFALMNQKTLVLLNCIMINESAVSLIIISRPWNKV